MSMEVELLVSTLNTLKAGGQTDVLVMDFSKAFDKVSHGRFLHKLAHDGVRGRSEQDPGSVPFSPAERRKLWWRDSIPTGYP